MTDLEMTKRCAQAMGWEALDVGYEGGDDETPRQKELNARGWMHKHQLWSVGEYWIHEPTGFWIERCDYVPLHDDAQAMALVKRLKLSVGFNDGWGCVKNDERGMLLSGAFHWEDMNRAIVVCVSGLPTKGDTK